MSGGVDSSVAAALLAQQGHEVIGLSMQLYDQSGGRDGMRFGTCCTLDDLHDARRVAQRLGFPHYIVNFEEKFTETVVSDFVREYSSGRTPIPCVHCNGDLKFSMLVERAAGLNAGYVATGHYARVEHDAGRYRLLRGADPAKDQSYFLFTLTQSQLAHAVFPVGALDKREVRETARALGLEIADKRDSHEICFVPDGDHAAFLAGRGPVPGGGAILDTDGREIGRHDGVHRFTVGQRKGLGISAGIPLYVVGIDAARNAVTVGARAALEKTRARASDVNWIAGAAPEMGTRISAQIRHRHTPAAATIRSADADCVEVEFDHPQAAIAPGQALVLYDRDEVLGGGWID
jgi:tRNA-specific 2-thiouridylase